MLAAGPRGVLVTVDVAAALAAVGGLAVVAAEDTAVPLDVGGIVVARASSSDVHANPAAAEMAIPTARAARTPACHGR